MSRLPIAAQSAVGIGVALLDMVEDVRLAEVDLGGVALPDVVGEAGLAVVDLGESFDFV